MLSTDPFSAMRLQAKIKIFRPGNGQNENVPCLSAVSGQMIITSRRLSFDTFIAKGVFLYHTGPAEFVKKKQTYSFPFFMPMRKLYLFCSAEI